RRPAHLADTLHPTVDQRGDAGGGQWFWSCGRGRGRQIRDMNHVYVAPAVLLETVPPVGIYHAVQCGDTGQCLVTVERWVTPADQDAWEAVPGVLELVPWDPVPAAAIAPLRAVQATIPPGKAMAPIIPIDASHSGHAALKKLRS